MPAVVITGSSSGIGAPMRSPSTASAFHVFAGVHRQEDGQALRRAASERLLPVRIDVTDGASITAARDLVAPGSTPPDCRAGQQRRHHGGVPRGVPAAGRVPPAAGGQPSPGTWRSSRPSCRCCAAGGGGSSTSAASASHQPGPSRRGSAWDAPRRTRCPGVGKNGPGLGAGLPDIHPPVTKRKDALDLGLLLARIRAQVEMEAILGRLDVAHGHEADAHRRGRIGTDDDLLLVLREDLPTQHLRPEPGEGREVMGVDDDVVQRDCHPRQCACSVTSPPAGRRGASASNPDGQPHTRPARSRSTAGALGKRFCVGCALIIPMIIHTILLHPSGAVWTDEQPT
jgi:hypothetical protein